MSEETVCTNQGRKKNVQLYNAEFVIASSDAYNFLPQTHFVFLFTAANKAVNKIRTNTGNYSWGGT